MCAPNLIKLVEMLKLIGIILLFAVIGATEGAFTGFQMPNKYLICQDKANFLQAVINCKQGGMELASIESPEEQAVLDTLLEKYKIYGSDNGLWVSGIRAIQSTDSPFYWLSTGEKLIYTKWAAGQPDNWNGKEHCVHWTVYETHEGMKTGWNDYPCDAQLKYICERK